jgi:hypothetical protein
VHPPYWLTHAAGVAAGLPEEGDVVLVGHGAAGALLPAIGRLARNREPGARVTGYLFVDSLLPRDGASRLDALDDARWVADLRAQCRSGWLPGWDPTELARLLPDTGMRRRFLAERPRTPLALMDEPVTVPEEWPDGACAYLALSDACPAAATGAAAAGWPVRRLQGHPLLALTDPERVAAAVLQLVTALGD